MCPSASDVTTPDKAATGGSLEMAGITLARATSTNSQNFLVGIRPPAIEALRYRSKQILEFEFPIAEKPTPAFWPGQARK
jgi:hypothetical protein